MLRCHWQDPVSITTAETDDDDDDDDGDDDDDDGDDDDDDGDDDSGSNKWNDVHWSKWQQTMAIRTASTND